MSKRTNKTTAPAMATAPEAAGSDGVDPVSLLSGLTGLSRQTLVLASQALMREARDAEEVSTVHLAWAEQAGTMGDEAGVSANWADMARLLREADSMRTVAAVLHRVALAAEKGVEDEFTVPMTVGAGAETVLMGEGLDDLIVLDADGVTA